MTPREFCDSIYYKQLVLQKEMVLNAVISRADDADDDKAEGLLHVLDDLQDCAAEIFGEEKVFLVEKKAEYLLKYRHYCNDNGLEDDSRDISTEELFDFVDNIIIPGEDEEL